MGIAGDASAYAARFCARLAGRIFARGAHAAGLSVHLDQCEKSNPTRDHVCFTKEPRALPELSVQDDRIFCGAEVWLLTHLASGSWPEFVCAQRADCEKYDLIAG